VKPTNYVGKRIKQMREAKNMTQDELADKSGVHRVTIAKYETMDIGMTLESAKKIADALGCTIDDLIRKEDSA
jgi:transcriptional regulator with XRE-family HTH domain